MKKKLIIKFLMSIIFLASIIELKSQIKCKIENYSTDDGLSHDIIRSIIKDNEGFMWFGTWDGISRFDGRNFTTYKATAGDKSDLENNRIDILKEDAFGYIWLKAYDSHIYRFDKKNKKFLSISKTLGDNNSEFDLIVTTKDGNIWLTSKKDGVYLVNQNRNGNTKIFNYRAGANNEFSIASNKINFLAVDKTNNIWVGSSKGLNIISQSKKGKFQSRKIISGANVNSFCLTGQTEFWFGTNDGNLIGYNIRSGTHKQFTVSNKSINSIISSEKGNLIYMTSSSGEMITFNTETLKTESRLKVSEFPIYKLYRDSKGLFWIEPDKKGVLMVDTQRQIHNFSQNIDSSIYMLTNSYEIFEDNFHRVWVKMKGGGFGYYNQSTKLFDYFFNKPGDINRKFSNTVSTKFLDPSGILWLSTTDGGINKVIFQEDNFQHKFLSPNTSNILENEVRAIYTDKKNRLWIASKAGQLKVYINNNEVKNLFRNFDIQNIGLVYTILEDSKGNIWLGTKGNGLYKATPTDSSHSKYNIVQYRADKNDPNSISSDLIYSILEDRRNRIWIGTYGEGINLAAENGNTTSFIHDFYNYPVKESSKIRFLKEGYKGEIWVATTNGLITFDPGNYAPAKIRFKRYVRNAYDAQSINSNDVLFIIRDSNHKMWLSTAGGGLNLAEQTSGRLKFRNFTKQNGLASDFILSMVEDNAKNLWLATENGISKFSLANHTFRNFDSYDGLLKTSFSESASSKSVNGDLYFGCKSGYLVIHPRKIQIKKNSSNLVFTSFEVNNKISGVDSEESPLKLDINNNNDIKLDYQHNTISIYYTTLDYRSSKKQKYAYRLKGLDDTWHEVGNQRRATFTNLAPGDYEFEVKCLNPELYSNIPQKKLAFIITPPFWRTNLAYFVYLLILIALLEVGRRIIISMIKLRNRVIVEQKMTELKLSFFTNISHELRTPLTLIVNPIDDIAKNEKLSPQGTEYIEIARRNTNRLVRFVNQLLDFRKVQSGNEEINTERVEIVSFINEIADLFSHAATERQIDIKTLFPWHSFYAILDRSKMDIVIYNLLSNAVKFSPDHSTITVEVTFENDELLKIKVLDEGIGVDGKKLEDIFKLYYESNVGKTKNVGTGIGLALCREYVQLHHGKIFAVNNAKGGLTVTVEINLTDKILSLSNSEESKQDNRLVVSEKNDKKNLDFIPKEENDQEWPTVLIVEDNNDLRVFLKSQLQKFYKVLSAENGRTGFEIAKTQLPDLILSDIMMPDMNGIELLQAVKNEIETSHIPFILLTAKSAIENQLEGLKFGADHYITKPFNTEILLAKVQNLINSRKMYFENLQNKSKTISLEPGEIIITTKDEQFLKDVIALVEANYADPNFNIELLIKSLNVSRATFNRKFKSLTNVTAVEFVKGIRVKRGRQFLDAGEKDIATVAYKVGFNNAGYFSTCFKEIFGISPSDYLKSNI